MLLMFKRTPRGLAAMNNDGKMFFPDRNSAINYEGLYDCRVTKEKENYAFVNGDLVDTHEPTGSEYCNLIKSFDISDLNDYKFKILKIGESFIFYVEHDGDSQFYHYYMDSDIIHVGMIFSDKDAYGYHHNKSDFYRLSVFKDINLTTDITFYNSMIDYIDELMMMKVACWAFTMVKYRSFLKRKINCEIYGGKYIIVKSTIIEGFMKDSNDATIVYVYGLVGNSLKLFMDLADNKDILKLPKVEIPESEIINFMMTNHFIGIQSTNVLESHIAYFNNERVELTGIYINHAILDDASENDKETARKSFEDYEAYRKRIGKYVSKDMYKEFAKISPKNMIFGY